MKGILALLLLSAARVALAADAQEPANPNANTQARAILKYFQTLAAKAEQQPSEKHLLSGQFANYGDWASVALMDRIHEKSGHYPALLGVDYAGRGGINVVEPNKVAIDYWRHGSLVTLSTHLYDPENLAESGGLRDRDVDLAKLLDENSESHRRWLKELDRVAEGLEQLKKAGVVVLWRPFHEMNGDWFWWNGKDPETFIKLWRQMFDYFTTTKQLNNLLWVYSPNHGKKTTDYYPGDRYVDIVGLDAYTDFVDPDHIKGYDEVSRLPKPFGFTEFGPHGASDPPGDYDYTRLADGIQKNFPRAVFFMCWNDGWSMAKNNNTKELLDRPEIINREDLPTGLTGSQ